VYATRYSYLTYISLVPVVLGVGLATYGNYSTNARGFTLTMVGAILAAIKTVVTNRLQTSAQPLSALDLLYKMSPLAMLQSLFCAYAAGEWGEFNEYTLVDERLSSRVLVLIVVNGILAFCLNLTSFVTNKIVGALTMTVAANIKQIISVILSVVIFQVQLEGLHYFGSIPTPSPSPSTTAIY
jgi:hypothetical protein